MKSDKELLLSLEINRAILNRDADKILQATIELMHYFELRANIRIIGDIPFYVDGEIQDASESKDDNVIYLKRAE